MCFSLRALVIIFVTAGTLVGCGLNLGEKAPPEPTLSFSGKSYDCLAEIPQKAQAYVSDQMTDQQITSFVRCLQDAFVSFAQYTRGRAQDTYAPDEIRGFIEKYFLKGRKISDQLLYEFMVIKQDWIGGSAVVVSRPELFTAVKILENIRKQAILLKPHLKVLNPTLLAAQNPENLGEKIQAANEALDNAIRVLTARLEGNQKTYSYADLASFLSEFRDFVQWDVHNPKAVKVKYWMELLKIFKEVTVTPDGKGGIRGTDWAPLFESMSRWYMAYIEYRGGVRGQSLLQGTGLENANFLAKQVFTLIGEALDRRQGPDQVITFHELDQLTQALHDVGWMPPGIRVTSTDQAIRALVTRVFGDPHTPPDVRESTGITARTLDHIQSQFHRWSYIQNRINVEFPPYKTGKTVPRLEGTTARPAETPMVSDQDLDSDWTEFMMVRSKMRPLFPDGLDRVLLVGQQDLSNPKYKLEQGFHNLSIMNILSSITSLIFSGYSAAPSSRWIWDSGISSDELQKFYQDFRSFGIDIKILDSRNNNVGHRGFIEGNLFTYASDGLVPGATGVKGELNYAETMQFFAFLYSGGQSADDLYNDLSTTAKCKKGDKDTETGLPLIDKECVKRELIGAMERKMQNLPHLLAYLKLLSPQEQRAFAETVVDTAVSAPYQKRPWIEHNELSTLAVVLYYSEAVMTRYDRNGDGVLDYDEIEAAMPIFTGFIKSMSKSPLSDADARGAFLYILVQKSLPDAWYDKPWVLAYAHGWVPSIALDRAQLAQVFHVIIQSLMKTGARSADTTLR